MSSVILTERQILESCIEDCFEGFKDLCDELEDTFGEYGIFVKPNLYNMTTKRYREKLNLAEFLQWGRRNPSRFVEEVFNVQLMDYQRYLIDSSWNKPFVVWAMSRNGGKSLLAALFIMAKMLLIPGFKAYILAGVGSQSIELFTKMEQFAMKNISSFTNLNDVFQSNALKDVIAKDIGEENMGTIWAAQQGETNLITIYSMASSPVDAYNTLDSVAKNYHKVTKNVFSNVIISIVVNAQMPRRSLNTVEPFPMAVVFSIFFAALVTGIVALISYMRETVKDAYDIEHELGVSLFGTIYQFKRLGEDLPEDKRREIISNHLMGFEFAESFRRMAIKAESLHRTKKAKVFMITSVAENEGKTMAAINLAIALSMNGQRTLLLDCDFKNPSIHKSFKHLTRPEGTDFHQYISKGGDISQFIRHDPESGVFIADCIKYCHNSPELLGSARFVETLASFREEFDFVIIDTPPCALTIDPEIIATHCDSALMMVRQD